MSVPALCGNDRNVSVIGLGKAPEILILHGSFQCGMSRDIYKKKWRGRSGNEAASQEDWKTFREARWIFHGFTEMH